MALDAAPAMAFDAAQAIAFDAAPAMALDAAPAMAFDAARRSRAHPTERSLSFAATTGESSLADESSPGDPDGASAGRSRRVSSPTSVPASQARICP
jgi:hypothetical protein